MAGPKNKPKKTAAKMAKRERTQTTMAGKLSGFFSFSNKKFIVLLVFVVGFAAVGSYWLYQSSSANPAKDLTTVQGCRMSGIVLKQGSSGSCVKVVQSILNFSKNRDPNGRKWPYLTIDGQYGARTALAVAAYQGYVNQSPFYPDKRPIAVDGAVGGQTWWWLENSACNEFTAHVCGD